jgi:uncharacterized protein YjbI with pentapeptide repeats
MTELASAWTEDEPPDDGTLRLPPGDRSLAGGTHEGRDFMFARLAGVDLNGADLYWASFHEANLAGAIMQRCDLRGARFDRANLRGADLRQADCGLDNLGGTTDFIGADLSGANLSNAAIGGADFTGALLVGANLSGVRGASAPHASTCFHGANLTDARLSGADLTGASYDSRTVFPRGFRPERAGMVRRGEKRKKWTR